MDSIDASGVNLRAESFQVSTHPLSVEGKEYFVVPPSVRVEGTDLVWQENDSRPVVRDPSLLLKQFTALVEARDQGVAEFCQNWGILGVGLRVTKPVRAVSAGEATLIPGHCREAIQYYRLYARSALACLEAAASIRRGERVRAETWYAIAADGNGDMDAWTWESGGPGDLTKDRSRLAEAVTRYWLRRAGRTIEMVPVGRDAVDNGFALYVSLDQLNENPVRDLFRQIAIRLASVIVEGVWQCSQCGEFFVPDENRNRPRTDGGRAVICNKECCRRERKNKVANKSYHNPNRRPRKKGNSPPTPTEESRSGGLDQTLGPTG
jgi:hypothetical protein